MKIDTVFEVTVCFLKLNNKPLNQTPNNNNTARNKV